MHFDEQEIFGDADDAADRRAFRADELAECERCGRRSPPTRMNCLYCGTPLPAPLDGADLRRPALKRLEEGERGFNVVLVPRTGARALTREGEEDSHEIAEGGARGVEDGSAREGDTREGGKTFACALRDAATLLRLEPELLEEMIAARVPLPLARTGERDEVELLESRLAALGLTVEIVSDDELAADANPPRRTRRVEFGATGVEGWGAAGAEPRRAAWGDLFLVVAGRIYRKRIEIEERARRAGAHEVVDARELVEDESVVDLYFEGDVEGWRIAAEGFDYSCLGARKGLLAAENFARLVAELRERAPHAAFDESYTRIRRLLRFAWPPAERDESGGLRHAAPGRFTTGAVTSVTNEPQFTRYGRLLRRFRARTRTTTRTTTEQR